MMMHRWLLRCRASSAKRILPRRLSTSLHCALPCTASSGSSSIAASNNSYWRFALITAANTFSTTTSADVVEPSDNSHDDDKKRAAAVSDDAFTLFSLPHRFRIDDEELRSTYREFMKDLHPDMQNQKRRAVDREELEQLASAITNAYDTLKRPHARAMHLLEILGVPVDETSGSADGSSSTVLMEIMGIREEIESAESDAELKPLFDANVQRMEGTCSALEAAFEAQDMQKAWQLTVELQYWNRIDETLRERMESLE